MQVWDILFLLASQEERYIFAKCSLVSKGYAKHLKPTRAYIHLYPTDIMLRMICG